MNPLFRKFYDAMKTARKQDEIVRQAGKLARAVKSGRGGFRDLNQVRKGFRDVSRAVKSGDKMDYGRVSSFIKDTLFREMMRALGPLGSIVEAMIRPSAKAMTEDIGKELQAAADLLTKFGYEVTPPVERGSPGIGLGSPASAPSTPAQPMTPSGRPSRRPQPLETEGETVEDRPRMPAGPNGNFVTVSVNGRRFRIRKDDPLLTGEMIKVKSSNVHSIGYTWNDENPAKGTLKVRFLDKRQGRGAGRAGAGYQYFEVDPIVFVAFTKAASKGKFVWDRLRIRGTVSGHQYRYSLATLASDGYVPRAATRIGDTEYFLRRTVKGTNGKVYRSALPDREVGPYNPKPNRGQPNRGGPNRGR